MHSSRVIIRSPRICRVINAPAGTRAMSIPSSPQYTPRFPISSFPTFSNELAPFFRLMDDFASIARSSELRPSFQYIHARPVVPFQPRFDVREFGEGYDLRGELPGVESSALQVEFTDPHTLVIRGSTTSETTSNTLNASEAQAAPVEAAKPAETNAVTDSPDTASTPSASLYQRATVEDEEIADVSSSASIQPTPTESLASAPLQETIQSVARPSTNAPQTTEKNQSQQPRRWLSERVTGSFQRVFNFPARLDQETVKASLKNGVLHIIIPKAATPVSRKITVE